jgi:hypothetical protein
MVPLIILGVASVGMAGVIVFGATRIFRPRTITLADLPELPAPPKDKPGGGPTMQA